jgi:hypothetical protein
VDGGRRDQGDARAALQRSRISPPIAGPTKLVVLGPVATACPSAAPPSTARMKLPESMPSSWSAFATLPATSRRSTGSESIARAR